MSGRRLLILSVIAVEMARASTWSAGAWKHTGIAFMNRYLVTLMACLCGVSIGKHSPGQRRTTGADVDLRPVIGPTSWNAWIHVP